MSTMTHQIWLGSELPDGLQNFREQMIHLNPMMYHMLWDEQSLKAVGFDCEIAATKFPKAAGVSNAARIYVVCMFGGIYMDADFVHHKNLSLFHALMLRGVAGASEQEPGRYCNAFFFAPHGHAWIQWQQDRIKENEGLDASWGVDLMTAAPRDGFISIPSPLTYPYRWDDAPEKREANRHTIIEHLWNGSWLPKHS